MLALACPSCGAPCRVSLETPDVIACTGCGKRGAPPAAAKEAITRAARVIEESSERKRQLQGLSRVLVGGALGPLYAAFSFGLALWSAFVVEGLQPRSMSDVYHVGWVLPLFGAFLSLLLALPAFVSMGRSARRLRKIMRAAPPLAAGQPAACRICGAPLGTEIGVVRCRHCRSDNLLDADVTRRAGEAHALELRDLEEEARSLTTDIADTRRVGLIFSVALSAFAVPLVAVLVGDDLLEYANVPLDPEITYAVDEGGGSDTDFRTCLRSSHGPRAGAYYGDHPPAWVIGHGIGWTMERVVAVKHNIVFGDVAIATNPRVGVFHGVHLLEGLCVEGMPPGVTAPKNPKTPPLPLPPLPATSVSLDNQPIDRRASCEGYASFLLACGVVGTKAALLPDASSEAVHAETRLHTQTAAACKSGSAAPYDEKSIRCYQTAIAPLTNPPLEQPRPHWQKLPGAPYRDERNRPECKAWTACAR